MLVEGLQDLLELTPRTRCPFHCRGLERKLGIQEIPGATGKFGLGVQNEAKQRLIEFCQEKTRLGADCGSDHELLIAKSLRISPSDT